MHFIMPGETASPGSTHGTSSIILSSCDVLALRERQSFPPTADVNTYHCSNNFSAASASGRPARVVVAMS